MTDFLIKLFVKDYHNHTNPTVRTRYGNFASITGILCNVFLCIIKGIAGIVFNSVAIIADAVNNLSDAGNSIISLIGFIISGKPSDEDHPYGHARFEYISCMLVSFFILMLGLSLLKTSVGKIFNPEEISTSILSIVVLIVSILVKLWMGLFNRKIGKKINSDVIMANSVDSFNDVISTSAVLLTTIIAILTNVNLDAYAGAAVSIFIIFSGISVFKQTVNQIIGIQPDKKLINLIVNKLNSYEGVMGIHDLVVHSYGPDRYFATVHVEVPVDNDILSSHDMIDNIERDFSVDLNINLVIHLDPVITDDEETNAMHNQIINILKSINNKISMHDFRMVRGETHSNLIFDAVMPYDIKMSEKDFIEKIKNEVTKYDEKLYCVITVDRNYISM